MADLADFRRFFTNIVQKDEHFLDRKMKVCDACCTRFYASADESMSVEMTKLVVGAADGVSNRNLQSSLRRSVKTRASLSLSKCVAMYRIYLICVCVYVCMCVCVFVCARV